jgi:hypothetical protein
VTNRAVGVFGDDVGIGVNVCADQGGAEAAGEAGGLPDHLRRLVFGHADDDAGVRVCWCHAGLTVIQLR